MLPVGWGKRPLELKFPRLKIRRDRGWITSMTRARRLGVEHLGPHAFEDCMPSDLYQLLLRRAQVEKVDKATSDGRVNVGYKAKNESYNVIAVIKQLIDLDASVQSAWLCHPSVCYISRMSKEKGFCGYRNFQMMLHHALGADPGLWQKIDRYLPSHLKLNPKRTRIPGILEIQELIETAWDKGYKSECRIETGGLKGTRKYFGTPEVDAILSLLKISFSINFFRDKMKLKSSERVTPACDELFPFVLEYFTSSTALLDSDSTLQVSHAPPTLSVAVQSNSPPRARNTNLAPLYLQRHGHSLTIVGIERHTDGSYKLLVFDPAHKIDREVKSLLRENILRPNISPTSTIVNSTTGEHAQTLESQLAVPRSRTKAPPIKLLDAFRRDRTRLLAHDAFEIVQLTTRN